MALTEAETIQRMWLAGLSERTMSDRLGTWRRVRRTVGIDRMEQLDEAAIERWWSTTERLAPASRRVYLSHVRAWYLFSRRPDATAGIRAPRLRDRRPHPISDTMRRHLLDTVTGDDGVWIALMLLGGLRCVEVARLRPADVRDDGDGPYLAVEGKGGRFRSIPAHPIILDRLADYRWPDVTPVNVSLRVGRAMRAAGVDATAHALRHTAATAYMRTVGGEDALASTSRFLGHADIRTTMIYAETSLAARRAAVGRMLG